MKYNQKKHKIRTIWGASLNNENALHRAHNEDTEINFTVNDLIVPKVLYDSGWNSYKPSVYNRTSRQNEYVMETFHIGEEIILNIPEHYLPFLKVNVLVKTFEPEK